MKEPPLGHAALFFTNWQFASGVAPAFCSGLNLDWRATRVVAYLP